MRWVDHVTLNIHWLGLNIQAGSITPVILPFLVALFVPQEVKNTHLATIRVITLAVAMMVQPMAGMLSDRHRSPRGRRRPFILVGTVLNLLVLVMLGATPSFAGSRYDDFFLGTFGVNTAYMGLLVAIVLMQLTSNYAQGALLGLIPDQVPESQRGRSSGVKAVFELLPALLIVFVGPLVDAGKLWVVIGIIMGSLLATMLGTVLFVREKPLERMPEGAVRGKLLRLIALAAIFVGVTQGAVWLVGSAGRALSAREASVGMRIGVLGLAGLAGMAGSIFAGVYLGAWVGIGKGAKSRTSFIWWVVNRLLFLAAASSIEGFAQFFLSDVLHIENAATMTAVLMAAVAVVLVPAALGGGHLADRIGRKPLVSYSGLLAAGGTFLLLFASGMPGVILSGCIIGLGAGAFMATNWALGTGLVPAEEAGRYLGISNLAGAGAGIVGQGIGGPMADSFNLIKPGLGYLVIFAIYAALFLLSIVVLRMVREPARAGM